MKSALIKFSYRFLFFSILWYKITMFWSKKKNVLVTKYKDMKEIPKAFGYGTDYRVDELFGTKSDHLTHPSLLQHRLNQEQEFGDCDDHAIYWCVSLLKSGLAKKVWFAFYSMQKKDSDKRNAHAVCVFSDKNNQVYWADYRNPLKIDKVRDFMYDSAEKYRSVPVVGAICVIEGLREDDTPIFGKITRLLP